MDSAFLPRHYQATPRQNQYISILALSPVTSGGAAFVQAPGSYRAALEAGAALPEEVQAALTAKGCRTLLPELVGQGVPGSGVSECRARRAREVTMAEGDL